MKLIALTLLSVLSSTLAAPAIVWSKESTTAAIHTSDPIALTSVLAPTITTASADKSHVVFVLGRTEEGNDSLTSLASADLLPKVASEYASASQVHHFVKGNESPKVLSQQIQGMEESAIVEMDVSKFNGDVMEGVTLIQIPATTSASTIDTLVSNAIHSSKIASVTLTSIRPLTEVLLERDMIQKAQYYQHVMDARAGGSASTSRNRRRLEDAQDDDGSNTAPLYYVHTTPNILSGILFFGFFTAVALVGLTCMASIGFSDVYVDKYPAIGKEV